MTDMHAEETAANQAGQQAQGQARNRDRRNQARRAGTQLPQTKKTRRDMAALGVSRRQLEYWIEMGWVRSADAKLRGHPRSFTPAEMRVLALMVRLTGAGIPARVAAGPAREAAGRAELSGEATASIVLAPGLVLTMQNI